jgi:hypothetical protein
MGRLQLFKNRHDQVLSFAKGLLLFHSFGLGLSCLPGHDVARADSSLGITAGMSTRTLSYTIAPTGAGAASQSTQQQKRTETLSGPQLCERAGSTLGLGLALGLGGCAQVGGAYTFTHVTSMQMSLFYFPSASQLANDALSTIRLKVLTSATFYISAIAGVTKITHNQSALTNLTHTTDTLDVGGGGGFSYRFANNVSIGVEANYLFGIIMSQATVGSSTQLSTALTSVIYL